MCDETGTAVYRIQIHVIRQHVTMVWQYEIDNADATDATDCDEVRVRKIKKSEAGVPSQYGTSRHIEPSSSIWRLLNGIFSAASRA